MIYGVWVVVYRACALLLAAYRTITSGRGYKFVAGAVSLCKLCAAYEDIFCAESPEEKKCTEAWIAEMAEVMGEP